MTNDDPIILSEAGQRRQQQILRAALQAGRSRHQRRVLIGVTSMALACGLVVVLSMQLAKVRPQPSPVGPTNPIAKKQEVPPAPVIIVRRIETDPNILQRLALPPMRSTIRHINEDELLKELADAHQPAGIISINGKAQLIFR